MNNSQTMSPIQTAIRETIFKTFQHEVIKLPLAGPDNQPSPHYGLCFDSLDAPKPLWMQPTVKKHYVPHTREDVARSVWNCLRIRSRLNVFSKVGRVIELQCSRPTHTADQSAVKTGVIPFGRNSSSMQTMVVRFKRMLGCIAICVPTCR